MSLNDDKQTFGVTGIGYWYAEDKLKEAIKELKEAISDAMKETEKEHETPNAYIDMVGELLIEKLDKIFGKELCEEAGE